MLALILGFVLTVVGGLGAGIGHAPGLADLPTLPTLAEDHSQARDALQDAGRPVELPAVQAPTDVDTTEAVEASQPATIPPVETGQPETVPPVDVSNAPEEINLGAVPADDAASVPDTVGAADPAELPDQAGGVEDVPPVEVPAEQAVLTGACAAGVHGQEAAGCSGQ
jgi:hypothetical protein